MAKPIFFILVFLFIVANSVEILEGHSGIKFEMVHRHDMHPRWAGAPPLERLRHLAHSDMIRVRAIQGGIEGTRRRQVQEKKGNEPGAAKDVLDYGELPMRSGAEYGAGQYLAKFRVGSPAQKLLMIVDTGSDLTWSNCMYMCPGGKCTTQRRRVFHADRSSSFTPVSCSSDTCKFDLSALFSLAHCPSQLHPCSYHYTYADGSSTAGLFANETVTFSHTDGTKTRLDGVILGCSDSSSITSFPDSDGVMGLGYSNFSLGVKAANRFGGSFSYCLVDHLSPKNVSSYLIFGNHKAVNISVIKMQYTELVLGVISSYYAVNIKGISVGGVMLAIPPETWDLSGEGGAIVDSGTSLMVLADTAYHPLMEALKRSLLDFERVEMDIPELEYCFNSTGFNETLVPRFEVHFSDGARLVPPVKSYVIDAAPEVKCIGFAARPWPGVSVIGNIMQQNHFWEFDLSNRRMGFATSSCI